MKYQEPCHTLKRVCEELQFSLILFPENFSKLATDFNTLHLTYEIASQLRITFTKGLLISVNSGSIN